jgi:hypothetical protein
MSFVRKSQEIGNGGKMERNFKRNIRGKGKIHSKKGTDKIAYRVNINIAENLKSERMATTRYINVVTVVIDGATGLQLNIVLKRCPSKLIQR